MSLFNSRWAAVPALVVATVVATMAPTAAAPPSTATATAAAPPSTATATAALSANTWSGQQAPLPTRWTSQVSPSNALPDYPRPQLARPSASSPKWISLNGLWQFQPTDGYSPPPFGQTLTSKILVPYPTESVLSGVQAHSDFTFYRRLVTVPAAFTANHQHVRLNFGAVNYDATVYVNGTQVARHTGGYEAFSVDVTAALRAGAQQEIIVAVYSPVDSANVPVGKQRLSPGGIFYTASSGIWQTVWLEPTPATSVASFTAVPDVKHSTFTATTTVNGDATNYQVLVVAYSGKAVVASAAGRVGVGLKLSVKQAHLWSPDDPFLYTFKVFLLTPNRSVVGDVIESYAGMRSIAVASVNGRQRITLNGKPTFLLSTLDQGFWPDGIYTAPTDDALKFDIQKTKDLGFNTIRKHIKVEPARWYYWADKLGIMVWQDSPALPTGRNDSLSNGDEANFRSETARMVNQLKNVTSIIGWIPFNEGWGQWSVPAAADVGAQIKALDPSRLVDDRSGANCCDTPGDPGGGDVIDWHVYQGPALPAPDASRASIDGEHGGLTLTVVGHTWPGVTLNPYGSVADAAELNSRYEQINAVLRDQGAPYGLSGSVYTQLTDVEGEQNGLFTYDREIEKVDEARIRASNLAVIAAGAKPAPPAPPGTPGLAGVDRWKFDETGGDTAADSAGSHALTLHNGASFGAGLAGDALQLNGNAQYADSNGTLIPSANTNYSVSAWVNLSTVGGQFQTVMSEDGDQNSAFYLQYSGADHLWAFSFTGTRALASTVGQPLPGVWYHLVGIRDVTNSKLSIYVNGALAGSVSVLGSGDQATGNLEIGRGKYAGNPVDYLNGAIDNAQVFDRALSADEISALDAAGPGA